MKQITNSKMLVNLKINKQILKKSRKEIYLIEALKESPIIYLSLNQSLQACIKLNRFEILINILDFNLIIFTCYI